MPPHVTSQDKADLQKTAFMTKIDADVGSPEFLHRYDTASPVTKSPGAPTQQSPSSNTSGGGQGDDDDKKALIIGLAVGLGGGLLLIILVVVAVILIRKKKSNYVQPS